MEVDTRRPPLKTCYNFKNAVKSIFFVLKKIKTVFFAFINPSYFFSLVFDTPSLTIYGIFRYLPFYFF